MGNEKKVSGTRGIPGDTKNQHAYELIKEDILNNVFPPGTEMVERTLCERYNMSRSPIRSALQMLSQDGLLAYHPGRGMIVKVFSTEDILEVYDLMELLQTYAIRRWIVNPVKENISHLKEIMKNHGEAIEAGDIVKAMRYDDIFHEALIKGANNQQLRDVYGRLSIQSRLYMSTIRNDFERAADSYREHNDICLGISNGDEEFATESLRKHYAGLKRYYINRLLASWQGEL